MLSLCGVGTALQLPSAPIVRAVPLRPHARRADNTMLTATLVEHVPTLLADDGFGKTFLAGMSIALSSVVTTVFVGLLVRGNYDDIEKSFFEMQEDALEESRKKEVVSSEAQDFFGDINVREAAPPPREGEVPKN